MCKEDWRLSRKAVVKHIASTTSGDGTPRLLCKANPNRYSLSIVMEASVLMETRCDAFVYVKGPSGYRLPVCRLTQDHPTYTASLLDIGQLVTEELWVSTRSVDDAVEVYITQTELLTTLEEA